MPSDVVVLVATAVLAVVTVVAAVVAVLAARRVARGPVPAVPAASPAPPLEPVHEDVAASVVPGELVRVERTRAPRTDLPVSERSGALAPRVVEGRVVVPPTQDQVVAATLSRPQVRLAVVAEGLAHALRPESRDRIGAADRARRPVAGGAMNPRLIWFVAGSAAGVYASVKARRAAYRMSMPGLIDQAAALGTGVRAFADEVRDGMTTAEHRFARELAADDPHPEPLGPATTLAPLDAAPLDDAAPDLPDERDHP